MFHCSTICVTFYNVDAASDHNQKQATESEQFSTEGNMDKLSGTDQPLETGEG